MNVCPSPSPRATMKAHHHAPHHPRPYRDAAKGRSSEPCFDVLTGFLVAQYHGDVLVLFEDAVVDEDYFAAF